MAKECEEPDGEPSEYVDPWDLSRVGQFMVGFQNPFNWQCVLYEYSIRGLPPATTLGMRISTVLCAALVVITLLLLLQPLGTLVVIAVVLAVARGSRHRGDLELH